MPSGEGCHEKVHCGKGMLFTRKKIYVRRHAKSKPQKEGTLDESDEQRTQLFCSKVLFLKNKSTSELIAKVWGYLGMKWENDYTQRCDYHRKKVKNKLTQKCKHSLEHKEHQRVAHDNTQVSIIRINLKFTCKLSRVECIWYEDVSTHRRMNGIKKNTDKSAKRGIPEHAWMARYCINIAQP